MGVACLVLSFTTLAAPAFAADTPAWIEKSNAYTQTVIDVDAKYNPEGASQAGADKYDTEVTDLKPGVYERGQADLQKLLVDLKAARESEQDKKVQQDLEILISSVSDRIESARLNHDLMLPYFNLGEGIFEGLQLLLDERNSPERKARAIERLKKYAGDEDGVEPITKLAEARTSERFGDASLVGPYVKEVNKALANTDRFLDGIAGMFKAAKLKGWEHAHRKLARELHDYDAWVRREVLPRARQDNRLPEPIYADNLKQYGVTLDPRELIQRAEFGFTELRDQMQAVAARVAQEQGLPSPDYRDVIRELKKKQITGEAILPFYKERLKGLEQIIAEHQLVTLPAREASIRLSSEAEAAALPAPHMNPPRLIGNTGEYGEFVLPLRNPDAEAKSVMDDFTTEAYAWTLTAHESRPGHELQFSAMVENGVSLARALYAFNSANVEGWGLYAEALVMEYLPPDGQLFSLQSRLLRAARAFIDPKLNLGLMTPEEAKRVLVEEVGMSEPFADQEVDRYTFRAPGQATAYYVGYMNLRAIRLDAELALRDKFNLKAFDDFVIAQGLLPPEQMRKAVMEEFVPSQG